MEETDLPGFLSGSPTLFCATMAGDYLLQATPSEVVLVACGSLSVASSWKPARDRRVTVATANPTQVRPSPLHPPHPSPTLHT
jgi:hypothetical protein